MKTLRRHFFLSFAFPRKPMGWRKSQLTGLGVDWHVVPHHVCVGQAALELVQHRAFAGVAASVDIAEALRKNGHGLLQSLCAALWPVGLGAFLVDARPCLIHSIERPCHLRPHALSRRG